MQTAVDPIAELDFEHEVCCEFCDNPATLRAIHHSCSTALVCRKCYSNHLAYIYEDKRVLTGIYCLSCKGVFLSVEEWVWIQPL